MPDEIEIAQSLPIREAGFDEYWLQDQIVENPPTISKWTLTRMASPPVPIKWITAAAPGLSAFGRPWTRRHTGYGRLVIGCWRGARSGGSAPVTVGSTTKACVEPADFVCLRELALDEEER
jgi:hypothetical protein